MTNVYEIVTNKVLIDKPIVDKPKKTKTIRSQPAPIIKDKPRQKYTGILLENLQGLSSVTKSYITRSCGASYPPKSKNEIYAMERAYKAWKMGQPNTHCVNPRA